MIKVVIAGSRTFNDYELLKTKMDAILQNQTEVEIVSGTAYGADQLGERYAQERGYPVKRFPAQWEKFGRRAGYLRNEEMANYASHVVVFTNGSKGSQHMIDISTRLGLPLRIVRF